ncbi:PTS glucitol/sorbitol transporter subunit IIA [Amycolatopsis alkalitolerans]|uniref:PTS sorbitol transporter subunit IIA n=1 Tax=Amycolatopsis alkalitolerans TaxID=2547244 RepID=A0A5C4MBT7_9PSEU|nr:PTS glucitol/sorbitol transporter subunit IIA [Amycolatopsis alkalitolerans]TNC29471.1 PTS sorbitol transporter subunit IIA [Amycolatopsis alkalitolerans]
MTVYYESTILRSGAEAQDMVDGGVVILYADPIPDALEEVSVVHAPVAMPGRDVRVGDIFRIGEAEIELIAVGERADENLRTLGHIVVYLNPDDGTTLLPGAVHGRGSVSLPASGARLSLSGGGLP